MVQMPQGSRLPLERLRLVPPSEVREKQRLDDALLAGFFVDGPVGSCGSLASEFFHQTPSISQHFALHMSSSSPGCPCLAFLVLGLVLSSAMHRRNADAKRPGMHSNAKRWNEKLSGRRNRNQAPRFRSLRHSRSRAGAESTGYPLTVSA